MQDADIIAQNEVLPQHGHSIDQVPPAGHALTSRHITFLEGELHLYRSTGKYWKSRLVLPPFKQEGFIPC